MAALTQCTAFKITPAGTLDDAVSASESFYRPAAGLVQGTDGNLYGTAADTVFQITRFAFREPTFIGDTTVTFNRSTPRPSPHMGQPKSRPPSQPAPRTV